MLHDPSARLRGEGDGGGRAPPQEVRVPQYPSTHYSDLEFKKPPKFLPLLLTGDKQSMPKNGIFNTPNYVNWSSFNRSEKNRDLIHHMDNLFSTISCVSPDSKSVIIFTPLPPPVKNDKFPVEKLKTFIAFIFLYATGLANIISLAVVHDRLPKSAPLPDIMFDLLPKVDWALHASEIIMIISMSMATLIILCHKHRFIVLRRIFLIIGILYAVRSFTIYVTQVPVASTTYNCSPKENSRSVIMIIRRVMQLNSGFGMSINGQHAYCGDYIFSGHTVVLTMCHLIILEYQTFLFHWATWLSSSIGIIFLLVSRGHYTIDVVIAYYVTTRILWIYHTIANNQNLKEPGTNNYFTRMWWFNMFIYFEGNVGGVVPRQYEWPLPWSRFKRWNSKTYVKP